LNDSCNNKRVFPAERVLFLPQSFEAIGTCGTKSLSNLALFFVSQLGGLMEEAFPWHDGVVSFGQNAEAAAGPEM